MGKCADKNGLVKAFFQLEIVEVTSHLGTRSQITFKTHQIKKNMVFWLILPNFMPAKFYPLYGIYCNVHNECMDGSRMGLNIVPLNDH